MANTGDSYVITLKQSHLGWGTYRYTNTRGPVSGERYIPIPAQYARRYNIVNSNATGGRDILGQNIFNCTSSDGFFTGQLKAQGNNAAGGNYAKQFSVNNDLKALGTWFVHINAQVGDRIRVTWVSPTDITIEKI